MTKLEFIARQFGKARNKVYEHYVVTRIWHLLQDLDVKCITQQHVNKPDGKRYLTDMYFPQLGLHIEVDEAHHVTQLDLDQVRQKDIIDATKHEFERVKVNCGIDEVNRQIDLIVTFIKNKIADQRASGAFKRWDLEAEQNPQTYITKGYIDATEDVAFRTIADAASCFGRKYRGLQTAWVAHPTEKGKRLWFPKLYENAEWKNSISPDEETITEVCIIPDQGRNHVDQILNDPTISRLVFARVKGPLGDVMYRFKGEYKTDKNATNYETGAVHKRIETRVNTYAIIDLNS
ncbi:MAG: AbaSI family restriction endonuclease [Pyrinomonadaceae bacterium]